MGRRKALGAATAGTAVLAAVLMTSLALGAGGGGPRGLAAAAYLRGHAGSAAPGRTMALMRAAAAEFGVPSRLLLAISYDQTRWDRPGGAASVDGGYGVMDLTAKSFPAGDGRGDPARPAGRLVTMARTHDTLDDAARLLRLPAATLKTDERQNIRGAAAVLARYARGLAGGRLPASLGAWYGAVAAYSGDTTAATARAFADGVFHTLRSGASLTTTDGQAVDLPATPGLRADRAQLARLKLAASPKRAATTPVDCPATISCTWVPAAYAQDDPNDPGNYGDYDTASRPNTMPTPTGQTAPMKIGYIVIHDTEGSYDSTISTFQNPASYVSANYVVRSSDGAVTEMVRPHNVSWGAGDWYVNMHAINIENEGFAAQGRTWYTKALYTSTAALVRYLAAKYHIPLDRQHILGHDDLAGPTDDLTASQHWDPGPFWNWNHFMALVRGVSDSAQQASGGSLARGSHQVVTIDPTFAGNQPTITDCQSGGCVTLPKQPANFVYLRTGPGASYPLLGDPELHPGGGSGTTADSDWGDKATTGETFGYAGQSGNWTAIWFSGQKAWFYNPAGSQQKARYRGGAVVTPKAGLTSIPLYGAAYPGSSAYPADVPVKKVVKLAYAIPAGQEYPVITSVPTDYYYAATIDSSLPDDHTVIIGKTPYYQISFNHRRFFVRASDVTRQSLP
jgi:N-acetyl-anhydromuramyl-L-alanine amidase AmpD